jgi:hypothetical protein
MTIGLWSHGDRARAGRYRHGSVLAGLDQAALTSIIIGEATSAANDCAFANDPRQAPEAGHLTFSMIAKTYWTKVY